MIIWFYGTYGTSGTLYRGIEGKYLFFLEKQIFGPVSPG
jgi:hypothetical protein